MSKNIKITFELLNSTISLLGGIDVGDYDYDFVQLFGYVSRSLEKKRSAVSSCPCLAMSNGGVAGHPSTSCGHCDGIPF